MPNHLLIYVIVALNAGCQVMLIWRLKLERAMKWTFCALSLGVPLLVAVAVRVLVATGVIHARVAEQSGIEHFVTILASALLIAGPLLATGSAVIYQRSKRSERLLQAQ
ncbi:hypothetical protein Gbem_2662 [Citrifermentans bemidjiense Bem]|uniref:Uncharacterized protein n=1 Tax=Citrifermentans bemidjiense (strain ATCC BAA-1014 / DSM 16622 / JCM 12645 / Bem) TaxID=404380 RepID=B5EHD4_CITBB|nr:hypothetical protein [Citrifermentans bemidjiense]ACH39670.1 hypothetical protein Gbem_2662 [Citrifermentans bemidjiense Bem]